MPNVKRLHGNESIVNQMESGSMVLSDDKYVQKEVERMRKAREERERVKRATERGIFLQNENGS